MAASFDRITSGSTTVQNQPAQNERVENPSHGVDSTPRRSAESQTLTCSMRTDRRRRQPQQAAPAPDGAEGEQQAGHSQEQAPLDPADMLLKAQFLRRVN